MLFFNYNSQVIDKDDRKIYITSYKAVTIEVNILEMHNFS